MPISEYVNLHTSWIETFNLLDDDTTGGEDEPTGFRAPSARIGPRLGAARLGMTVYDLPPGEAVCPITSLGCNGHSEMVERKLGPLEGRF